MTSVSTNDQISFTPDLVWKEWQAKASTMWNNRVALLTGVGSANDIGGTTAQAFAALGVQTVLCNLSSHGFAAVTHSITEQGGKAPLCLEADVTSPEAMVNVVKEVESHFGRLDFAFNNAGMPQEGKPIGELDPERVLKLQHTNLVGIWNCIRAELPLMQKGGFGAIVNTASVLGLRGAYNSADYCASKAGVIGLTKGGALDVIRQNIRINAICPGAVDTPLLETFLSQPGSREKLLHDTPLGGPVNACEIARGVVFLCSPDLPSLTGTTLTIDGGMTAQIG